MNQRIQTKRERQTIYLPRLKLLRTKGVLLYRGGKEVALDLSRDLTAVMGANGLGKSTLLSLVLYGITGIVRKPGGTLQSLLQEKKGRGFLAQGIDFGLTYFEGRVTRAEGKDAFVEIEYSLGPTTLKVRRGFFSDSNTNALIVDGKKIALSSANSEEAYRAEVARFSNITSFEQFVFLVHTVQLFDEDHLCLFWEQTTLNQILACVLTGDSKSAENLTALINNFKKHDSHVRNIQYQITNQRKVLAATVEPLGKKVSSKIVDRYAELNELKDELEGRAQRLAEERAEALAKRDEAAVELDQVSRELQRLTWELIAKRNLPLSASPILQEFSETLCCPLCRHDFPKVPGRILKESREGICPLCETKKTDKPISTRASDSIDATKSKIASTQKRLKDLEKTYDAISGDHETARNKLRATTKEIGVLEGKHNREALEAAAALKLEGIVSGPMTNIRKKIDGLQERKDKHRTERDEIKKDLKVAQKNLIEVFETVRGQIVPRFQELANSFLGIPLNLSGRESSSDQVPIVELHLTISESERKRPEQLSESQRYFLDIALRMTLLSWLSSESWTPTLVIDTPEGALDIAYETNAGKMFAAFIAKYQGPLLTASNLNSSRLIRKTLEKCRKTGASVTLLDLREWGRPSEVQKENKPLMDEQITELRELAEGLS
jgi:DNA repair exonuclease SbcCD ATPase subunit